MNSQISLTAKRDRDAYLPIYVAGFGASAIAFSVFYSAVGVNNTALPAFLLLALGFWVSWMVRTDRLSSRVRDITVGMLIVGSLALVAIMPKPSGAAYGPYRNQAEPMIANVLIWLMTIYSFNLGSAKAVLFLCVPAISLFGIIGTYGVSENILLYFIAFLALAAFVMLRQNTLTDRDEEVDFEFAPERQATPVRSQGLLSLGVVMGAIVLGGLLLGSLLYLIAGRTLYSAPIFISMGGMANRFTPQREVSIATGPAPSIEREILTVKSKEGLLWRGQTFDWYVGGAWSQNRSNRHPELVRPANWPNPGAYVDQNGRPSTTFHIPQDPYVGKRRSVMKVEQIVQPVGTRFGQLFGAAEPTTVIFDSRQTMLRVGNSIATAGQYGSETTYKVVSEVSTATPAELRAASSDYPAGIRTLYLTSPQAIWQVGSLAKRVTEGQRTAFDKALAIEKYLKYNYTYDANTKAPPDGRDPIEYFLFGSKRGYCDSFSSAMVIMCRQVGVPARWVTGFGTGQFDDSDGKYHVKVKNMHAWAEVYFPEYGWITFDATPGGGGSEGTTSALSMLRRLRRWFSIGTTTKVIVIALVLIGLYLLKTEVLDRILKNRLAKRRGALLPAGRAGENYRMMCSLLARFGYPKSPSNTPSEYAQRAGDWLSPNLEHLSDSVNTLTADFEEARYGLHDLAGERLDAGAKMIDGLLGGLRQARKDKLLKSQART